MPGAGRIGDRTSVGAGMTILLLGVAQGSQDYIAILYVVSLIRQNLEGQFDVAPASISAIGFCPGSPANNLKTLSTANCSELPGTFTEVLAICHR